MPSVQLGPLGEEEALGGPTELSIVLIVWMLSCVRVAAFISV